MSARGVLLAAAMMMAGCAMRNGVPMEGRPIRKITTVSDSLTNNEPTNWVALVGKELGAAVQPEAHGGWTTRTYFKEKFAGKAFANLATDADLCIILIGSNNLFEDAGGSEKSIAEAVEGVEQIAAYVEKRVPGVKIMLAAPPIVVLKNVKPEEKKLQRRIDDHTPAMLKKLSVAYRELAARRGWLFVDLQPVLTEDDYVDAAHPGVEGNRKIAAAVLAALKK